MVQQVQQWVINTQETTLETIEAVGTSSKKLIEWRQTTWEHFIGYCSSSWSWNWWYDYNTWERSSWLRQITLNIGTVNSKYIYSPKEKGIRVPKWWTYKLDLTWYWWASTMQNTLYIKNWTEQSSPTIYTYTSTSWTTRNYSTTVNLWKFDIITARWSYYYSWDSQYATLVITITNLTLTES